MILIIYIYISAGTMKDVVTWRTKLSNPPDALRIYHTCMDALTHLCKYLSLDIYIYNHLRQSRSVYIYTLCIYVELQDARAGSGSSILTTSTRRHCCSSASHHPVLFTHTICLRTWKIEIHMVIVPRVCMFLLIGVICVSVKVCDVG